MPKFTCHTHLGLTYLVTLGNRKEDYHEFDKSPADRVGSPAWGRSHHGARRKINITLVKALQWAGSRNAQRCPSPDGQKWAPLGLCYTKHRNPSPGGLKMPVNRDNSDQLSSADAGRKWKWVAASHPSAAMAGLEVLKNGGNAIDAGVAVGLALNVRPRRRLQLPRRGPHRHLPLPTARKSPPSTGSESGQRRPRSSTFARTTTEKFRPEFSRP